MFIFLSLKFVLWASGHFERGERLLSMTYFERFCCFNFGASTRIGRSRLCVSCACVLVLWFLLATGWATPNFQFGSWMCVRIWDETTSPFGCNTHSPVCDAAKLVLKSKALKALVFIAAVTICLFYFGNVRRTCVFFGCRHLIAHIFKWILFWGCVGGRELQRRFGNPCASFRVRVRSLQCLFWNVAFVKKFFLELHRQCCFYFFWRWTASIIL